MTANTIHLQYPNLTMFQMVEKISRKYPQEPAYEFYNKKTSYYTFIQKIEQAAAAFILMSLTAKLSWFWICFMKRLNRH